MATSSFWYTAYGLIINSNIPLPELIPYDKQDGLLELNADVVITVAQPAIPQLQTSEEFEFQVGRAHTYLIGRNIGRFLLESGREVSVEPAPDVQTAVLRSCLLGQVLALLLFQRGFLVLHASAVALRGEDGQWHAVGFLGDSGEGKSTMAGQLHAHGHRILCDDVVAIPTQLSQKIQYKEPLSIFPGFPQLRMWPQSLEVLGREMNELPVLAHHPQRRVLRDTKGFEMRDVPLRRLYVLKSGDHLENQQLSPSHAVMQLARHAYVAGALGPENIPQHFQQCGEVAQTVPMNILQRPRDLSRLSDIATIVENEVAGMTQTDSR